MNRRRFLTLPLAIFAAPAAAIVNPTTVETGPVVFAVEGGGGPIKSLYQIHLEVIPPHRSDLRDLARQLSQP